MDIVWLAIFLGGITAHEAVSIFDAKYAGWARHTPVNRALVGQGAYFATAFGVMASSP